MRTATTGLLVFGVALVAVGGTVFRVATAPDRIRDRIETARKVCAERGGEWVTVNRREQCRLPGATSGILP
ncbi:hypothetical protein [Aquabacterium sp.]|uniref:hypothetical protein n=1 Tax=Aquabacterium sp. TaxID=1872578 RepID=UPI002D19E920|nr:hypothetical protein [Aquabacterium sp.]HSW04198.1 hypothetical protein [Aquabacterium sp.]